MSDKKKCECLRYYVFGLGGSYDCDTVKGVVDTVTSEVLHVYRTKYGGTDAAFKKMGELNKAVGCVCNCGPKFCEAHGEMTKRKHGVLYCKKCK